MFFIHGGGFLWGSSSKRFYGPEFLLTQDIVLVTLNYRLGILGFLSLEDPALKIPGNAGLKDMVMALRWVQKNIGNFGGDCGNVTIFGESAGGAAVHLLCLSPLTKGLFHKAIAQSGTALNPWARSAKCGNDIAKAISHFEGKEEESLMDFLIQVTPEKLLDIQEKVKL